MRGCSLEWGGQGAGADLPRQLVGPQFLGCVFPEKNLKENLEGLIFFGPYLFQVCVFVALGEVTELNMV